MENNSENINQSNLIEVKQVQSFIINDEDEQNQEKQIENDNQSTTDTIVVTDEIEAVLNQKSNMATVGAVEDERVKSRSIEQSSESMYHISQQTSSNLQRSIYQYASHYQEIFEHPRQSKLEDDVTKILGSSDPPAGFGFLHPRFYSLEQERPSPMKPLQVWRGYNGNVYFSPIQVHRLDSDRNLSPSKASSIQLVSSISKSTTDEILTKDSTTIKTRPSNNKSKKYKKNRAADQRISTDRRKTVKENYTRTSTHAKLQSNLSVPSVEEKARSHDIQLASSKMWQSVVSCAPVHAKPISKRSLNAIEDMQALQQEQAILDPTGYHRQVLPNIRPVPKSKFVYKGLAYKETQRLPGITNRSSPDQDGNGLEKPLVAYNLAQAYARYELDAARAKPTIRPPPPSAATGANIKDPNQAQIQVSLDLREKRKRIIKGTTLSYRPPAQSMIWTPGRADQRSNVTSEVRAHRPSTSKSSIPQKQTTLVNIPLFTKYLNQNEDSARHTRLSDVTNV